MDGAESRRPRRRDHGGGEADQRVRAAWMYYIEGLTQEEIAERLGLSRVRVLRMLAECREDGTVQFRINARTANCIALGQTLEARYGIAHAIVVPAPVAEAGVTEAIGAALGDYLNTVLCDGMTVGLGWGQTLRASLKHVVSRKFDGMTVVSLLGALTRASAFSPSEFAWRFADLLDADCYFLAAPVIAPDPMTRDLLFRHAGIEEVMARAARLDLAIVSVGDLTPESTLFRYAMLPEVDLQSLIAAGAVGDLLCNFLDENGVPVDHEINRRVIAASPETMRRVPHLVLASGGWRKLKVMYAAIRLLAPRVLITDEATAEGLAAL
ncbi:MAG TPA: sugar-binding transcriptional regulator [Acidiphilium sp.]